MKLALTLLAALGLPAASPIAVFPSRQTGCPSYAEWAMDPHWEVPSNSTLIPNMRPSPRCRQFTSAAVEATLVQTASQIHDNDWKQLFANIFPNTLDTAVAWHSEQGDPYTFIVTGDINAQWIRDSTNQVMPLIAHLADDRPLRQLVLGLVNMQAEQLGSYLFGNAYKPPARSGLRAGNNPWADSDVVYPPYDKARVFEAKFELDSLAAFLKLSYAYWAATNDTSFAYAWTDAVPKVVSLVADLQVPTIGISGQPNNATVRFQRKSSDPTESVFVHGEGNPVRYTGMARSLFRPSDDACMLPFLVPANAMLSVELANLARMLNALAIMPAVADDAARLSAEIRDGVLRYGTRKVDAYGQVFVYETDGFGSSLVMDDANVPSLLALPELGFVDNNEVRAIYRNTRRLLLSRDNPWFFEGSAVRGIGSPHTGLMQVWPMAIAVQGLTSESREEVAWCLSVIKRTTAGLGLIHESVDADDPSKFTRPWFAWCNGVVSELVIRAVKKFPGII